MQRAGYQQDYFLNQGRKEKIQFTFILTNGFQFRGYVKAFDNFTVIIESEGAQMLVYKHAISTIKPMRQINLAELIGGEGTEAPAE